MQKGLVLVLINAKEVSAVLRISLSYAYKVIHDLKKELAEKGYYVSPTQRVPITFFCERIGLNETEVRKIIGSLNCSEGGVVNVMD